jgi:hypothetical protein
MSIEREKLNRFKCAVLLGELKETFSRIYDNYKEAYNFLKSNGRKTDELNLCVGTARVSGYFDVADGKIVSDMCDGFYKIGITASVDINYGGIVLVGCSKQLGAESIPLDLTDFDAVLDVLKEGLPRKFPGNTKSHALHEYRTVLSIFAENMNFFEKEVGKKIRETL